MVDSPFHWSLRKPRQLYLNGFNVCKSATLGTSHAGRSRAIKVNERDMIGESLPLPPVFASPKLAVGSTHNPNHSRLGLPKLAMATNNKG
jgi:hypothetical protein